MKKPWDDLLKRLQQYHQRYGHVNVPEAWEPDPTLAQWVENLHATGKKLPGELRQELVKLNFDFNPAKLTWDMMYNRLLLYWQKHGHTDVPFEGKLEALAQWTLDQRIGQHRLAASQIIKLNEIHFDWEGKTKRRNFWDIRFEELKKFKETYGHTKVVETDSQHRQLSTWVHNVRARHHRLTQEQKKKLNQLGFLWQEDLAALKEGKWTLRYEQLKLFKKRFGHCNVPIKWSENKALATWVSEQRLRQKHSSLPPDRKQLLDKIDFSWSEDLEKQYDQSWKIMYERLRLYKSKYGHLRVARADDPELRSWVLNQRVMFRGGYLSKDRQKKLQSIGFVLSAVHEVEWEKQFNRLKEYKKINGTLHIPKKNAGIHKGLAEWQLLQRQNRAKGILTKQRIKQLDTIGIDWTITNPAEVWMDYYRELVAFKKKFKPFRVSQKGNHKSLSRWIDRQRKNFRNGNLAKDRLQLLTKIGLNLSFSFQNVWTEKFQELVTFKKKFGHLQIPTTTTEYRPLNTWAKHQREAYHAGSISKDRYDLLDGIGFNWNPPTGRRKMKK